MSKKPSPKVKIAADKTRVVVIKPLTKLLTPKETTHLSMAGDIIRNKTNPARYKSTFGAFKPTGKSKKK